MHATIESIDDISRIISNSFNVENRTREDNNTNIVSQSIIHPNSGSSCTNHISNKNSIPRELAYPSSYECHRNSLNKVG